MKVDYVRDLGASEEDDSFKVFIVVGKEKHHIRTMRFDQLKSLREANEVPEEVTDTEFLFGDPQFQQFMRVIAKAEDKTPHIEYSVCKMSPKKTKGQRVEFPANAFEGGTKKSTTH